MMWELLEIRDFRGVGNCELGFRLRLWVWGWGVWALGLGCGLSVSVLVFVAVVGVSEHTSQWDLVKKVPTLHVTMCPQADPKLPRRNPRLRFPARAM